MHHIYVLNKAELVHYMLHAKHSKLETRKDKIESLFGEDFVDVLQ